MLAALSIVALSGFLMRPVPPKSRTDADIAADQPVSAIARSAVRDLPDGYQAFPSFTSSRGGYGAEPPDYTTGPSMKPTMGYGRNSSAIKLHALPPKGYVPSYSTFENISTAPIRAGAMSKVPGPEPWTSKPVATVSEMTGPAGPDRMFGMQEVFAAGGARDNLMLEASAILSKNWTQPQDQIMVRKPNPQQAHLEKPFRRIGSDEPCQPVGDGGPAAGDREREQRAQGRPRDLQMSVLPERSLPLSTIAVHDAGGQETACDTRTPPSRAWTPGGPRSSRTRTPARGKRAVHAGDGGSTHAVMRPPANERTRENLVSNADGERMGTATHANQDLHVHTRTSETKVFQNIPTYADKTEGRLIGEDFIDDATTRHHGRQIRAVRDATEQATNSILEERGWVEGFRVERPAKVGSADVEVDVGEKSAAVAYAALRTNQEYIKNVNQELEETSGLAYL
eukprot:jgi/Mesvir1/10916/Mv11458-RA.1